MENYAYDISLDSSNNLMISKFKIIDENEVNKKGKVITTRKYNYIGCILPTNIKESINELLLQGYLPINKFRDMQFEVTSINPLVSAKLLLLCYQNRLLEKYYEVNSETNNLEKYITYINMKNGEIFKLKIGSLGLATEIKIKDLENEGYISVTQSFYESYEYSLSNNFNLKR